MSIVSILCDICYLDVMKRYHFIQHQVHLMLTAFLGKEACFQNRFFCEYLLLWDSTQVLHLAGCKVICHFPFQ